MIRETGHWIYYKDARLPLPYSTLKEAREYIRRTHLPEEDTRIAYGKEWIQIELKRQFFDMELARRLWDADDTNKRGEND